MQGVTPLLLSWTSCHGQLARWRKWRACNIGEAKEGLENKLWCRWSNKRVGEWALLILQSFRHFTYVTTHFPTLLLLYLSHISFSNLSFASPTLQALHLHHLVRWKVGEWALVILQPFGHFAYVTAHFPTLLSLYLHHSSFSNPSFASPTSHALHLHHLVSCPCFLHRW